MGCEVAARHVSARRGVVVRVLQVFPLDPVERRAHGRVMGVHHRPPVVADGLESSPCHRVVPRGRARRRIGVRR